MPGGDGTGPMGMGPMTGRAMGYCSGYPAPGFVRAWPAGLGRGFWPGFGRGRGNRFWARATGLPRWYRNGTGYAAFGRWPVQQNPYVQAAAGYQPQLSKDQEVQMLEQERGFLESQIGSIKSELEEISKRISQIKKGE